MDKFQKKGLPGLDRFLEKCRLAEIHGHEAVFGPRHALDLQATNLPRLLCGVDGVDEEKPIAANDKNLAAMPPQGSAPPGRAAIYRVTCFRYHRLDNGRYQCIASLFNQMDTVTVQWIAKQPDTRLSAESSLVSVKWSRSGNHTERGALPVDRVVKLERPERAVNLFSTIPPRWVADRQLVALGMSLLERMPKHLMHLFNAIFWDGGRFYRFCTGPSSLRHHHAGENGNLRHSIEVALGIRREIEEPLLNYSRESPARQSREVFSDELAVAVMSGLLHDAGKADEYRLTSRFEHVMTRRGCLLGHKLTVVEWIAAARALFQVSIPDTQYLELVHNLTAANGAPDWLGTRRPQTLAASYLSSQDRISGVRDRNARGVTNWS